jgi:NTP pyrophosphatase (non-canonical NTP hydrolase)
MELNSYQTDANRTLIKEPDFQITPDQVMLAWNGLGLAGESGEVADLIKKGVFHQQGIDKAKLTKELGDVLWYIAAICSNVNVSLEEVAGVNIAKLKARYPEGYSPERSVVREGMAA